MLARRLPGLMPALSPTEALEVTAIHSVAGLLAVSRGVARTRPFRSPHHTVSEVGLVGGGHDLPRPGEVSLAHHGVLFLDELAEFRRGALEALRQPLEDGVVSISRAHAKATFPARPVVVCAMNPCACGYLGDGTDRCRCSRERVAQYRGRLSGPLLDRIDVHVALAPVSVSALQGRSGAEASAAVRARVERARAVQRARFERDETSAEGTNASLAPATSSTLRRSATRVRACSERPSQSFASPPAPTGRYSASPGRSPTSKERPRSHRPTSRKPSARVSSIAGPGWRPLRLEGAFVSHASCARRAPRRARSHRSGQATEKEKREKETVMIEQIAEKMKALKGIRRRGGEAVWEGGNHVPRRGRKGGRTGREADRHGLAFRARPRDRNRGISARPRRRDLRSGSQRQDHHRPARHRGSATKRRGRRVHRRRAGALDVAYARSINGVDTERLLISQPDTGEQALEITEMLVRIRARSTWSSSTPSRP